MAPDPIDPRPLSDECLKCGTKDAFEMKGWPFYGHFPGDCTLCPVPGSEAADHEAATPPATGVR